jgi:A/G-specific adenine glycosylase
LIKEKELPKFRAQLLEWYQESKRQLPWRTIDDSYAIWVSEVMLQQTQTRKVLEYYARFLKKFPSVKALARVELDEVLKVWEGLGYYARARNLHRAAKEIVAQHNGKIPRSYEELRKVQGIGPYTAAAVASIAFSQPKAVVYGNVIRVISRLYLIDSNPKQKQAKASIAQYAEKLLDRSAPGDFNQAMMELGATLCTPRKPKCMFCPVSEFCAAYQQLDDPARLPVKPPPKVLPHYNIAAGLIWDEGYIFIDRREENGLLGGLWEFPGGKIEDSETPQEAVKREIRAALDLDVEVGDFFMEVKHAYTHFKITLHVYHCLYKSGEPRLTAATDWRWVKPEELEYYAFASANKKIIQQLLSDFAVAHSRN